MPSAYLSPSRQTAATPAAVSAASCAASHSSSSASSSRVGRAQAAISFAARNAARLMRIFCFTDSGMLAGIVFLVWARQNLLVWPMPAPQMSQSDFGAGHSSLSWLPPQL
eukprot:2438650-Prymnesium_polylepis.1